jgi:hypothetical protein
MLPVSLDCTFLIAPSVFSNVYLYKVINASVTLFKYLQVAGTGEYMEDSFEMFKTQCSNEIRTNNSLWSQTVCLRPMSCVPNVSSVSGLSILDCPFGFL